MSVGRGFEAVGRETRWQGRVITVGEAHYRHADGAVVARDEVRHPGAVAMLAVDDTRVWLTRQPREVAGLTASLEIPAGKLDIPGEAPLAAARRELDEEIGKAADEWHEIAAFYTSAGFSDERIILYLARGLSSTPGDAGGDEDERIEIVPWPLDDLEAAICESEDAKTGIALMWLARRLSGDAAWPSG